MKEVIGGCTLILGDSFDIMGDVKGVGAVVTDPPYGMDFQSNRRKVLEKHDKFDNDKDSAALQAVCDLLVEHSKYIFCRWDNLYDVPKPKSLITWIKNNHSMGDLEHEHARQTEVCLFYPGENHFFPKKRPSDIIRAPRTANINHPTEKPVQLMRAIIEWTDGRVFDPFMGSGSTGVACAKMGREFIGIENEQKYFDIACKRIEEAYGQLDMFASMRV